MCWCTTEGELVGTGDLFGAVFTGFLFHADGERFCGVQDEAAVEEVESLNGCGGLPANSGALAGIRAIEGSENGFRFAADFVGVNHAAQSLAGEGFHGLKAAETAADGKVTAAEIAVKYGDLISTVMYFLVVAFVMFMIVKGMNAAKKKEAEAPPPPPPADITLLTEIRDLLKK